MKAYTWSGVGYQLQEAIKTEQQYKNENINCIDLESVICTMIDHDEIVVMNVDEIYPDQLEEMMNDESWTYIDNTCSDVKEKKHCYMALIENLIVE